MPVDLSRAEAAASGREMSAGSGREIWSVAAVAALVSLAAFAWFFRHGQVLLYGDAVAHLNIARRVFDSRIPGADQLGTVWLPLPHLLSLPFLVNNWLWRSGVGGSIASMLAYVFAVCGIYRLVRGRAWRLAAWVAAGFLGLNPNLLYMQSTAMTEPLFLAELIWATVFLDEFVRGLTPGDLPKRPAWCSLERLGVVLAAAILTRYDGWVLAFVAACSAAGIVWRSGHSQTAEGRGAEEAPVGWGSTRRRLLRALVALFLLCALTPSLWLAHNYYINQRPLDWYNGPYSAKAIEARSTRPGDPPHPGTGNVGVAALYFLKVAKMNAAEGGLEKWMLLLAVAGALLACTRGLQAPQSTRAFAWLLLWLPLPFYAYSVAYGSVPIFLPVWYPFSYYNVRYGLELLPAFAAGFALVVEGVRAVLFTVAIETGQRRAGKVASAAAAVALLLLPAAADLSMMRATPVCLREAQVNSASRLPLQAALAERLRALPPDSTLLMATGEHVGALQLAGVPLRRVLSEVSKQFWDVGLSCPAQVADYVVAIENDEVAQAVRRNPRWLEPVATFTTMPGNLHATIYRSVFPRANSSQQ